MAVSLSSLKQRVLDGVDNISLRKFWETGLGLKFKIHPLGGVCALASLRDLWNTMKQRELRVEILK
jgi:hypothetical protein